MRPDRRTATTLAAVLLLAACGGTGRGAGGLPPPAPSASELNALGERMFPLVARFGYYGECTYADVTAGATTGYDYRACPVTEAFRLRLVREQVLLVETQNPSTTRDIQVHPAPGGGTVRVVLFPRGPSPLYVDLVVRPEGSAWLVDDVAHKGGLDFGPGPAAIPLEAVAETNRQKALLDAQSAPPTPASTPASTPGTKLLQVPAYRQALELSCEEAALRMALAWENIAVTDQQVLDFIGVDTARAVTDAAGNLRWGDPYVRFVGNPNGSQVSLTGYGTYYPTIASAAGHFGGHVLRQGEGVPPPALYDLILHGHPAVVWVAYHWATPPRRDYVAFDGRTIPYAGPIEHAVTLVGVRPDSVWINNPLTGLERISKPVFEAAYAVFGNMAVVLD